MFRHAHIAYSIDAYSILCDYTYVIVIIQFRGSIIVQVSVTVIQKTDFGCCQAVLEDGNFVQQSIKESIICLSLESWDEIQRLSSLFLITKIINWGIPWYTAFLHEPIRL